MSDIERTSENHDDEDTSGHTHDNFGLGFPGKRTDEISDDDTEQLPGRPI